MLQGLPIALAQVKARNTFENIVSEIRKIKYSLNQAKEINKEVYWIQYNEFNKVIKQNEYYIYQLWE